MMQGAQTWCSVTTERGVRWEGGVHAHLQLIHVDVGQKTTQWCK